MLLVGIDMYLFVTNAVLLGIVFFCSEVICFSSKALCFYSEMICFAALK